MRARNPEAFIDHFVALVLSHIDREYPHKLDHVINDATELKSPRTLHPVFCGSFDWHSSVHGHWLLVRALRCFPSLASAKELIRILDERFTPEKVRVEVDYLGQKQRGTFERPYGWGWMLKLAAELREAAPEGRAIAAPMAEAFARWSRTLQPLTDAFVDRYLKFLPKATYPVRVGTHQNSAFALTLTLDYARVAAHQELDGLIKEKARAWYGEDSNYPAWEPDGSDFLSPGLVEAECMRRVLGPDEFLPWFDKFLPNLAAGEPATLFKPAFVSDRTDGQITHLDGLNLSRAWCWRSLAGAMRPSDPRRAILEESHRIHLDSALAHVTGDYMGEHWLASFAMLAMTE